MDLAFLEKGKGKGDGKQQEAQRQAFMWKAVKRAAEEDIREREARREGAAIAISKSKAKKEQA
eukprot:5921617-Heterocapsa_arctica.AAC.1